MNSKANKDVIKLPDKAEQNLIALFAQIIVSNVTKKSHAKQESHSLSPHKHRKAK